MWMIAGRYSFFAGNAFVLFYLLFRRKWLYKKIQLRFPENKDYLREFSYSMLTIFIFTTVTYPLIAVPSIAKHTTLYMDIAEYGWFYYFALFPVLFVMHDTYFYFAHRLMHHKKLFNLFHLVHHKSTNPSPWAAYAFHPLEAVVEVGIVVVFLFTVPIHKTHLLLFFLMMIVYNVYGHLGYELYPKGFHKTRIGRWINTSVNHNQHHQYFKGNYGLYFLFWDRVLGTIREDYDTRYVDATTRTKQKG
ncbi:MAG: sterol desaturase family protein [Chitinophagaceae bacterium]|nr:sterol desaturase family protein [Chitinophagaceae bacterium]MCA6489920.1 sterol desaturase family protein [Chitinophagaceae bacterium]MCA6500118.1 sterol desaturase family protein [Chitinophagaceae bacterium]MCA6516620.1 sterol desaturase family protein [Chitinophagaceae bacterium]